MTNFYPWIIQYTLKKELDKENLKYVQIISYAVKYASSYYGPFRYAIGSKK